MAVSSIFNNMLFKIYFTSKEYLFCTLLGKKFEYHLKKLQNLFIHNSITRYIIWLVRFHSLLVHLVCFFGGANSRSHHVNQSLLCAFAHPLELWELMSQSRRSCWPPMLDDPPRVLISLGVGSFLILKVG